MAIEMRFHKSRANKDFVYGDDEQSSRGEIYGLRQNHRRIVVIWRSFSIWRGWSTITSMNRIRSRRKSKSISRSRTVWRNSRLTITIVGLFARPRGIKPILKECYPTRGHWVTTVQSTSHRNISSKPTSTKTNKNAEWIYHKRQTNTVL